MFPYLFGKGMQGETRMDAEIDAQMAFLAIDANETEDTNDPHDNGVLYLTAGGTVQGPKNSEFLRVRPGYNMEGAQVGAFCHVFGLTTAAGLDLNTAMCRLECFITTSGRWRVSMIKCNTKGWYGIQKNRIATVWPDDELTFVNIKPINLILLLRKNIPVELHTLKDSPKLNGELGFLTRLLDSGDCEIFLHGDIVSFDEYCDGSAPDYPKVVVNHRHVSPTIFIGSRIMTVIPGGGTDYWNHRECFITCYRPYVEWDVAVMHGTKILSMRNMCDKYVVPCCKRSEMVMLDLDNGPRSTATEERDKRAHMYGSHGWLESYILYGASVGEWRVRVQNKGYGFYTRGIGETTGRTQTTSTVLSLPTSAFVTLAEQRHADSVKDDPAHDAPGAPLFGKLQKIVNSTKYRNLACDRLT